MNRSYRFIVLTSIVIIAAFFINAGISTEVDDVKNPIKIDTLNVSEGDEGGFFINLSAFIESPVEQYLTYQIFQRFVDTLFSDSSFVDTTWNENIGELPFSISKKARPKQDDDGVAAEKIGGLEKAVCCQCLTEDGELRVCRLLFSGLLLQGPPRRDMREAKSAALALLSFSFASVVLPRLGSKGKQGGDEEIKLHRLNLSI